ncbi:MAG: DsbA family protein [Alphaproteobacteria bacterium]
MPLRPTTLIVLLAVAVVLAAALAAVTLPGVSVTDGSAFERRVRTYLLAHPDVIADAVVVLRQRKADADVIAQREAVRANRSDILSSGALPVAGNPNGDVTVVEFFDYNCPYCRQAFPLIRALLAADTGIRLVLREFPVLGPESSFASRAAIAASLQGKYLAFHDALMTRGGEITPPVVLDVAGVTGLDVERLKADMAKAEISAMIDSSHALARRLLITGTPTFIIGDELISGFAGIDEIKAAVALARSRKVPAGRNGQP